jgi:hypothetical protein
MEPKAASSSGGVTSAILPLAPDVLEIRIHVQGSGLPESMEVPIAVSSNARRFLLRAKTVVGSDGAITLVADNTAAIPGSSFSSRSRAINDGGVLALFDLPRTAKGPISVPLRFSIPAVPKEETREIVLQLKLEPLQQPVSRAE